MPSDEHIYITLMTSKFSIPEKTRRNEQLVEGFSPPSLRVEAKRGSQAASQPYDPQYC